MKTMIKYLRPFRALLLLSTVAIAVATVCDLLLPTVMSQILEVGVYERNFAYIAQQCLVMLLVALVGLAATLLGSKLSCDVVAGFCANVRAAVFGRVNQMSFEEFGKLGTAALVTRATHDVETVSWLAAELAGTVITIPVLFFGGVILSFKKDVLLSLILLSFLPIIVATVLLIGKRILPLWKQSDEYIDRQNDIMRERLRGIRVIRAFNAEAKEHERIAEATHAMAENIIKSNVSMGIITPLATLLLNIAIVLIVYVSGWRMDLGHNLSGADVFAIIQYVGLISSGVIMGAFSIIMLPHAKVAADRIGQVLHSEKMEDVLKGKALELNGDIQFDNVTFCYQGAAEPALRQINLKIKPGQKVAIIGGTGAGKSSLVSQLLGFRTPTGGQVLLSGIPTTELSRRTVRDNISCVLQNTTIYSGTIAENIRMGRQSASDAEIWEALEIAQAADFVRSFPDGLGHAIKQSGKNLSGGQKQRLSIARALLKNAPIYIFDDSFSALDFITEAKLRSALAEKLAGKTQIVITQRITSAMHADNIFVMDKGRIVDAGSHQVLLSRCRVYQEIYASQTGGCA